MKKLLEWDSNLLLSINSEHAEFWDGFMWLATNEITWLAFFAVIVYVLLKNKRKEFLLIVIALALTVLICDQVSGFFKDWVARPRPSREPGLMNQLHIVNGYRGGKFGFFSSHAANTFGIAVLVSFLLRNWLVTLVMVSWALVECYTRMYLGVHYPLDILTGIVFGSITGFLVYKFHTNIASRFTFHGDKRITTLKALPILMMFLFTVFMMLVASEAIVDFLL